MTTLQKTLVCTIILVAAGAGIYEAHQATQRGKRRSIAGEAGGIGEKG